MSVLIYTVLGVLVIFVGYMHFSGKAYQRKRGKCQTYRYVFIHPAGLDYMRQQNMNPKSFIIVDEEEMMFEAGKRAKEYAKKYPYWRVTVTNLPNDRLHEVKDWESSHTYFSIYE